MKSVIRIGQKRYQVNFDSNEDNIAGSSQDPPVIPEILLATPGMYPCEYIPPIYS